MNRRLALTVAASAVFALAGARRAGAQTPTIGYQGLPYKVQNESKTGIVVAEGMLLHLGAGAELGYDSNVFYSHDNPASAGILRLNGFGELTNGNRTGGVGSVPGVSYEVRAGLTYRRYFSGSDPNVAKFRDAYMPGAGLSLGTSVGTVGLQLTDTFLRQEDPPYAGSSNNPLSRDNNVAAVQLQWSPGGGRISGTLRYSNTIDVFEASSGYKYASSLSHQLMLDVSWKWLPKTAIFVQATQGYVTYLDNTQSKPSSFPLHIYAGLRGLITPKLTASVALGYANAFYSSGANTGGFLGSTYVDLQAIFTPSMLNRLTLGYHQDFVNSVISNFYYTYSVYGSYVQQLAGRLSVDLSVRFSHLDYQGLTFDPTHSRTDNTVIAGATLDYFFRSWIYAGVGYGVTTDFSDYRLPVTNAPVGYVKHQVFARLGVTY